MIIMKPLVFKASQKTSIGIELEFQLIHPATFDLISKSKDLIKNIVNSQYSESIKPEVTQSMIEINSSPHTSMKDMQEELTTLRNFLLKEAIKKHVLIAGGGTHPFQKWSLQKIFPSKRYKNIARQYRYLSKCSTVFGQHLHVGCPDGDMAIYLTKALMRFVPHFIVLSASSPFYQGIDTGFNSSRNTALNAYPLSGLMPIEITNWQEFTNYFNKLRKLRIVESMKDFYWDIRPKPEFGTVELRICDTPLTINKAVMLGAYLQGLASYLQAEKPPLHTHDLYYLYHYNRFQASRYGYDGEIVDPLTLKRTTLKEDMLNTMLVLKNYIKKLDSKSFIVSLTKEINAKQNDALFLRKTFHQYNDLPKVVREQCKIWAK